MNDQNSTIDGVEADASQIAGETCDLPLPTTPTSDDQQNSSSTPISNSTPINRSQTPTVTRQGDGPTTSKRRRLNTSQSQQSDSSGTSTMERDIDDSISELELPQETDWQLDEGIGGEDDVELMQAIIAGRELTPSQVMKLKAIFTCSFCYKYSKGFMEYGAVLFPCTHRCLCQPCFNLLAYRNQLPSECPRCRKKVIKVRMTHSPPVSAVKIPWTAGVRV